MHYMIFTIYTKNVFLRQSYKTWNTIPFPLGIVGKPSLNKKNNFYLELSKIDR